MTWVDDCIDLLIDGESLNIVGLGGTGRSAALEQLASALNKDGQDWLTLFWTREDVKGRSRRELQRTIASLNDPRRIPVLFVDDFGDLLVTEDGGWLDRMLFSKVNEFNDSSWATLRCVVSTYPRDREISGPSSVLRERCRPISPPATRFPDSALHDFACADEDALLRLTGGNTHLLHVGGDSPDERRGVIRAAAYQRLPDWIAGLARQHQDRLGQILDRHTPSRWRSDSEDPTLAPLVVKVTGGGSPTCHVPACITGADIRDLLLGQPWPSRSIDASARRLAARVGNEPRPLWVDNFLSDLHRLDTKRLVQLVSKWLELSPSVEHLRILSRDWVDGLVSPTRIVDALKAAGLSDSVRDRIRWRIYDQKAWTNLHRRELLLPTRTTAFTLPPAGIIVGQADPGNETDSEVAASTSNLTREVWANARSVL